MVIDLAILVGLLVIAYMNWKLYEDVQEIGNVVAQMLIELDEKGILKVEFEEDDDA